MTQIPRQTVEIVRVLLSSDREARLFNTFQIETPKSINTLGAYARFGGATSRKLSRFMTERAFAPL